MPLSKYERVLIHRVYVLPLRGRIFFFFFNKEPDWVERNALVLTFFAWLADVFSLLPRRKISFGREVIIVVDVRMIRIYKVGVLRVRHTLISAGIVGIIKRSRYLIMLFMYPRSFWPLFFVVIASRVRLSLLFPARLEYSLFFLSFFFRFRENEGVGKTRVYIISSDNYSKPPKKPCECLFEF